MSMNLRPSAHVEGGAISFKGVIVEAYAEVGTYTGSGEKTTQVTVKLYNVDEPEKQRKFNETWSIGKPTIVLPSNDGKTPIGEGEQGKTLVSARDPNGDVVIGKNSVYSQITHKMVAAGCPENELPESDFTKLVGLAYQWDLGTTTKVDGESKRLVPTKFYGRVDTSTLSNGNGNGHATATAVAAAPASNVDVAGTLAGLILTAVSGADGNTIPAKDLTKVIVPMLVGEYAGIKTDAVKLLVTEAYKKSLEGAVGVKYDGKAFSL